jgi:hypothetical protein
MTRRWATPLVLTMFLIGLAAAEPALAAPTGAAKVEQRPGRVKAALAKMKARFVRPKTGSSSNRLGIRESLRPR